MGIDTESLRFLFSSMHEAGVDLPGCRMLELGNQHLRRGKVKVAKIMFEAIPGVRHTSIDINGKDGALPIDLEEPVNGIGTFNVITNFGTSEHIEDQFGLWRNIHNLCEVGGVIVSSIPAFGAWRKKHGPYRYTPMFFSELADRCGYEVLRNYIREHNGGDKDYVNTAMVRTSENVFVDRARFQEIERKGLHCVKGVYSGRGVEQ